MRLHVAFLVLLVLAAPAANAQSADAPLITLDTGKLPVESACPPGSVVLDPETAVKTAKRLSSAEAKVEVYEKHPPLPWWGVVIVAVVAAGAGAGITIGIYEAGKARP